MVLTQICPPALIYLIFSITQVSIDTVQGSYNTALVKIWVAFVFTVLLNYLCLSGLGVISWLIVFIPFILMTIIVSMLLLMFGLDPTSGKIKKPKSHLTRDEKKAVSVAEMLAKDREENPVDYDYQPTTHGKTKISSNERKVLNDMVQNQSELPLPMT